MNKIRTTNTGEMIKTFRSRASIWSKTAPYKYMLAPSFGDIGMPRKLFDDLMCHLVWSEQPEVRPYSMSHEKYR